MAHDDDYPDGSDDDVPLVSDMQTEHQRIGGSLRFHVWRILDGMNKAAAADSESVASPEVLSQLAETAWVAYCLENGAANLDRRIENESRKLGREWD